MSWLTLLPTALETRISDLQKNPPVDTETIRAWAEHQQIYEKFREPSNVPKKLAVRLKKYEDSLLASRKRGIRHLPTIITVEMDIPEGDGMDNEDDAVDAVDEAVDEEADEAEDEAIEDIEAIEADDAAAAAAASADNMDKELGILLASRTTGSGVTGSSPLL